MAGFRPAAAPARLQVAHGDVILVVDVGGGTTDLSLIAVLEQGGNLQLQRVAVGEHILLGGDNMDLAWPGVARKLAAGRAGSWTPGRPAPWRAAAAPPGAAAGRRRPGRARGRAQPRQQTDRRQHPHRGHACRVLALLVEASSPGRGRDKPADPRPRRLHASWACPMRRTRR